MMALSNATSISFQAFCKVLENFGLRLDTWSFYRHCDIIYMMPSSHSFKSLLYQHKIMYLTILSAAKVVKCELGQWAGRVDWLLVNFQFYHHQSGLGTDYRLFHTYDNFSGCDPFQISQTKNERHSDESHHNVQHELMMSETMTPAWSQPLAWMIRCEWQFMKQIEKWFY